MVYKLPKEAIADDQIDADKISANLMASWVPINGIIMWSGTIAEAEALTNWAICDGTNGTPDLRDKFALGVGSTANTSTAAVDDEGGTADAVVVTHNHGTATGSTTNTSKVLTGNVSAVAETFSQATVTGIFSQGTNNNGPLTPGNVDNSPVGQLGIDATHDHDVSVTVGDEGVSGVGKNIPPYFALCYLMRTT